MTVLIVTDNQHGLPGEIIKSLGNIFEVPLHSFYKGNELSNLSQEAIYGIIEGELAKKQRGEKAELPTTSGPSLGEFIKAYEKASVNSKEIIGIFISSNLSETFLAAQQAATIFLEINKGCKIEIIDSRAVVGGTGLLVLLAARMAKEGKSLEQIKKAVTESINHLSLFAVLDSLTCFIEGGRGKKHFLSLYEGAEKISKLLRIKVVISLSNGEVKPAGRTKALEKKENLIKFIKESAERRKENVTQLIVQYATEKDTIEAKFLLNIAKGVFPGVECFMTQVSTALGVHTGPGALVLVAKTK